MKKTPVTSPWLLVFYAVAAACVVAACAMALAVVLNSLTVRSINGIKPRSGNLLLWEGQGIVITPNATDGSLEINATGVQELVAGRGIAVSEDYVTGVVQVNSTGVQSLVAGRGIAVSEDDATGVVEVNSTGVQSLVAGLGIVVTEDNTTGVVQVNSTAVQVIVAQEGLEGSESDPTFTVTLNHTLTRQTGLPESDPEGPQVAYSLIIGGLSPVNPDQWQNGINTGYTPYFFPGIVTGDGGQGNVGGTSWVVPAVGTYTVNAMCALAPTSFSDPSQNSYTGAIVLGATASADPTLDGYVPQGGFTTLYSAGPNPTPLGYPTTSWSVTFHAGCTGCPVNVGDGLTISLYEQTNTAGVTFSAYCSLEVTRIV